MHKIHVQVCFSQDANLDTVKRELLKLKAEGKYIFHHCFLPRHIVEEKQLPTTIIDMLDEILGDDQVCHLKDYATFHIANAFMDIAREEAAKQAECLIVIDTKFSLGIKKEIELFTDRKVLLLP